jgi:hypothetical protein
MLVLNQVFLLTQLAQPNVLVTHIPLMLPLVMLEDTSGYAIIHRLVEQQTLLIR